MASGRLSSFGLACGERDVRDGKWRDPLARGGDGVGAGSDDAEEYWPSAADLAWSGCEPPVSDDGGAGNHGSAGIGDQAVKGSGLGRSRNRQKQRNKDQAKSGKEQKRFHVDPFGSKPERTQESRVLHTVVLQTVTVRYRRSTGFLLCRFRCFGFTCFWLDTPRLLKGSMRKRFSIQDAQIPRSVHMKLRRILREGSVGSLWNG